MEPTVKQQPSTSFTDLLRGIFKNILDPIGSFLNSLGVTPNMMTMLGFFGNLIAAILLASGKMIGGGVIVLLMGPFDAIDGTMARLRGTPTRFGGVLDSVVDRYSELVIIGGLLVYFTRQENWTVVIVCYLAAMGSLLVSYTRARAEAAHFSVKGGFFTRVERYIVMTIGLLINQPVIAVWIIALLANFTAIQRMVLVYKQAAEQGDILK